MNQDDINLIRAAKRGHVNAFTDLVRNYHAFVYRTAYGVLQNQSDAEDVTQETFIKVHQSLKGLRDERTFPTWIARIAIRTALDVLNHHKRHAWTPLEADVVGHHPAVDPDADIRLDLEHAFKQLDEEHRMILTLREVQGFQYEELAQILEIPIGTVRSRLHNARHRLRLLLSGEGRDSK